MHIHSRLGSTYLHRLGHTSAHSLPSAIQGAWNTQTTSITFLEQLHVVHLNASNNKTEKIAI